MQTPTTDLMMQFLAVGKGAITAGASGAMTKGDSLSQDFKPDKYFEVEAFDFDLELKDDEGDRYKPVPTTPTEAPGGSKSFARWRAVKPGQDEVKVPYRCKPSAFSITRLIDDASPTLFKHCAMREKLAGGVLIKRGLANSGLGALTFLRMEFVDVMITSIEWSDGEVVKEKCRFTFRDLAIKYVRRKPDGAPDTTWPCEWHRDPKAPKTLAAA